MSTSSSFGNTAGVLGQLRLEPRPIVVLRRDRLRFRRPQELQVGLRHGARAAAIDHLVDDRDRRLGQDAERRHHDLELVLAQLLARQERLVLPGDEHVADAALHEGRRRAAGARVEDRHVLEDALDEVACVLASSPPNGLEAVGPRRQVVPAGAARRLRVRRDHRHAGPRQVVPVLDLLRVALADQEHDRRRVGRAGVGQPRRPVGGNQLAGRHQRVDVVGERQRDDVGLEAVDDRARLASRAAVRLVDGDVLPGLGLPLLGEGGVDRLIQLAGRIVGDVQERDRLALGRDRPRPRTPPRRRRAAAAATDEKRNERRMTLTFPGRGPS